MISYIKNIFHNPNAPMQLPEMPSYLKGLKKSKLDRQNADLVPYDMFAPDDSDREIVHKKLYGQVPFANTKEEKAFAIFLGTAIGNALGVLTEGYSIDYDRKDVKGFEAGEHALKQWSSIGHYTAGTSLALCIADSLLDLNFQYDGKDIRYRFLLWHNSGLNNGKTIEQDPVCKVSVGAGRTIMNSLLEFIKNPEPRVDSYGKQSNDNGNGTLIRIAPFPIAFSEDLNKCLEYATEQSFITHNGIEAAECAKLISFITWNFLNIESVGECKVFLENIGSSFKTDCPSVQCLSQSGQESQESLKFYNPNVNITVEDRNWKWKNADYKYSPSRSKLGAGLVGMYCMDATAMALHIIYHADSFKEAVLRAINLGGDSVSIGSIVGTLAGALFGYDEDVKKWYIENLMKWDEGKCAIRAYKLLRPTKAV